MLTPAVSSARRPASRGVGILALGVVIALLYFGRIFFITVIIAAIISFLLDPAVLFFMKLKMPRGLASFVVCSLGLMFLYLAGVGIYTEGVAMLNDLPAYGERINALVDGATGRMDNMEKSVYRSLMPKRFQEEQQAERDAAARNNNNKKKNPVPVPPPSIQEVRVHPEPTPLVNYIYVYLTSFYSVLLMASFVPFLVYFQLSWGDHLRTRVLYLFDGADRHIAGRAIASVAEMVRAYVVGNFLLGVVLSIASSILFASVKLPYWLVAGPVSGFLSLIPYIGLPLALMPPLIAALPMATAGPQMYLFLSASVALLHLFALNLLYPKFVGARVHLNPLVVTLALMFWGMLWGGIGLVLAIPLTAAIKAVCDNVGSLQAYGKLLGD